MNLPCLFVLVFILSRILQHHMLGPVQRIPRYKMLLEDYLKRLPEDSPDRLETSTALDLISKAADHTNESMRQNVSCVLS